MAAPKDPWALPEPAAPQREDYENDWGRSGGSLQSSFARGGNFGGGGFYQAQQQYQQDQQNWQQRSAQHALDQGGFAPGAGTPEQQAQILSGAGGNQAAGNRAIQALSYEGLRLRDEEQGGLDASKRLFNSMLPELQRHPLSERDINELAAGRLEEVAQGKMRDMQGLREHLGSSEMDGNLAGDLGIQAEIAAMGQGTQAMRGLRERHAEMTGQHQMQLLQTAGVAHQIFPAVSTYGAEAAEAAATHYGNMYAADKNYEAQKYAAKQQKQGGMLGGLLGLAGSIFSGGLF